MPLVVGAVQEQEVLIGKVALVYKMLIKQGLIYTTLVVVVVEKMQIGLTYLVVTVVVV